MLCTVSSFISSYVTQPRRLSAPEIAANPGRFHFKVSILGSPALLSHELRERGVRTSSECHAGLLPLARGGSEGTL